MKQYSMSSQINIFITIAIVTRGKVLTLSVILKTQKGFKERAKPTSNSVDNQSACNTKVIKTI